MTDMREWMNTNELLMQAIGSTWFDQIKSELLANK